MAVIADGSGAADVGVGADDAVLADDAVALDIRSGPDHGTFTDTHGIRDGAPALDDPMLLVNFCGDECLVCVEEIPRLPDVEPVVKRIRSERPFLDVGCKCIGQFVLAPAGYRDPREEVEYSGVEEIRSRVDERALRVLGLLFKTHDAVALHGHNTVVLRVVGLVNPHTGGIHPAEVLDIIAPENHVPVEEEEPVIHESLRRPKSISGPELMTLGHVRDIHAKGAPILEVVPDCTFKVADDKDKICDPRITGCDDEVFHHRSVGDGKHHLWAPGGQGPHPLPLSCCKYYTLHVTLLLCLLHVVLSQRRYSLHQASPLLLPASSLPP